MLVPFASCCTGRTIRGIHSNKISISWIVWRRQVDWNLDSFQAFASVGEQCKEPQGGSGALVLWAETLSPLPDLFPCPFLPNDRDKSQYNDFKRKHITYSRWYVTVLKYTSFQWCRQRLWTASANNCSFYSFLVFSQRIQKSARQPKWGQRLSQLTHLTKLWETVERLSTVYFLEESS